MENKEISEGNKAPLWWKRGKENSWQVGENMRVLKANNRKSNLMQKMTRDRQVNEIKQAFFCCNSDRAREMAYEMLIGQMEYEPMAIDAAMKELRIQKDGKIG